MNEYEDTHVVVSKREALISTVSYNIMATNDLACATVIFALFRLRKSPFYRFRVKQLANKVELERSRYEKVINAMMALVPDVDLNTDVCNKAIRELGKKLIDPDIIAKALLRQE